jgi:hypothetical protein
MQEYGRLSLGQDSKVTGEDQKGDLPQQLRSDSSLGDTETIQNLF